MTLIQSSFLTADEYTAKDLLQRTDNKAEDFRMWGFNWIYLPFFSLLTSSVWAYAALLLVPEYMYNDILIAIENIISISMPAYL